MSIKRVPLSLLFSGVILLCPVVTQADPGVSVGFSPEGTAQALGLLTPLFMLLYSQIGRLLTRLRGRGTEQD